MGTVYNSKIKKIKKRRDFNTEGLIFTSPLYLNSYLRIGVSPPIGLHFPCVVHLSIPLCARLWLEVLNFPQNLC